MPKLIRLYIDSALLGLVAAISFVCLLVLLNIGHLGTLVLGNGIGWVALIMLVVFFGTLFGGVHFAWEIALMREEEKE